ncbi:MAG TPA: hypothetical protein VIJ52_06325 [Pseudolabrys sp.]
MIKSMTCMLAAAFTIAVSGTAFASTMSQSEMATKKECQNMSKSAMQRNENCVALMKKYPDEMNGSGSMGSGSMNNGSMNKSSGSMNNGGGSMGSSGGSTSNGGSSGGMSK